MAKSKWGRLSYITCSLIWTSNILRISKGKGMQIQLMINFWCAPSSFIRCLLRNSSISSLPRPRISTRKLLIKSLSQKSVKNHLRFAIFNIKWRIWQLTRTRSHASIKNWIQEKRSSNTIKSFSSTTGTDRSPRSNGSSHFRSQFPREINIRKLWNN